MSLSILTNVTAMQTQQNLLKSSNSVSQSMERLSSGLRINTAADDAAGYAISQGLTSQNNGLDEASRNTNDAVSMVQTASSSLTDVQDMLQRVRELAVQYNNGSNDTDDQTAIQDEVDQLTNEISREQSASNFNGINLLNGTAGSAGTVTFQVGANSKDTMTASFAGLTNSSSGLNISGVNWANVNSTSSHVIDLSSLGSGALDTLTSAISNVSTMAATLGAIQNRLQYTSDSISSTETNLAASNSQIKDVDMAAEMTSMTQEQVLEQAGTAMLSQANQQPQMVLKLLQG